MNRKRKTLIIVLKITFAPSDFKLKFWFQDYNTHFPDYALNSFTGVWDL